MSNVFKPTTLATAVLMSLIAMPVFAQDNSPTQLSPLVVTASRTVENIDRVPARITVIDEAQIQQNPTLNISDVLQKDASISVKQYGGIGQVPEVSLRGSQTYHTLMLQDGARLNNQNNYGVLWTGFYDTGDIERIEILKGPASVQYGSDAIAGVVQFISKTPSKSAIKLTGIYGENNTYKAIVAADLVAGNGFYATVAGQRMETDGTRIFASQAKNNKAGYDQKGYSAKVGYDNQQNFAASVSIQHNKGTNIFNNGTRIINNAPRQFKNQVVNAKAHYKFNPAFELSGRYSFVDDKQNVPSYASFYNNQSHEADIFTRWNINQDNNILLGTTFNHAEYTTNTILNNKQDVDTRGYYAQYQHHSKQIDAQAGVRLEDHERFGHHVVGQGAIRYHFTPATSIYTNIGSAFRAPTLNELYTNFWRSNPNLKPEESFSYEVGADQRIGQYGKVGFSAYHTDIKNLIVYNISSNENVQKAKFTGAEVFAKWAKDALYLSTQYAYVKTKNKTIGTEIAYRPKHTLTLSAGYDDGKYGVSASLIARSKAYADTSNRTKVPGYSTVDVATHWNVNQHIKLFANIQNIGDVHYKEVYDGFSSPTDWYINGGRLATAGITLKY